MTKYTVTIDETKRTITVDLDGCKGTARCCPTDLFDIRVGTELALERAKVAKKNAEAKKAEQNAPNLEGYGNIMKLVKALEKALSKGECVLIGNGKELTKQNKEWLRSLIGDKPCDCENCDCLTADEFEEALGGSYNEGYDAGHNEGYDTGHEEGYDAGYRDGYHDGHKETLADILEIIGNID